MTIEIFYLTAQIQRWLNLQVAHHLETQAARLGPTEDGVAMSGSMPVRNLDADGVGISEAGLGRLGMSGCYSSADETESDDATATPRCSAAQIATRAGEKRTVHA